MSFSPLRSLLRWLGPKKNSPLRKSSARPRLELLEDRCVLDGGLGRKLLAGPFLPPPQEPPPAIVAPTDDPFAAAFNPAPAALAITGISEDRGTSGSDFVTNDTTLTVVGTGTPGLQVFLDAGGAFGVAVVDDAGNWSAALEGELYPGYHLLNAVGFDMASKGKASDSREAFIDVTPPEALLQAPLYTASTSPAVFVTLHDTDGNGLDSRVLVDVDVNHNGVWENNERGWGSGTLVDGLAEVRLSTLPAGSYDVRARGFDRAGNEAVSAVTTMEVLANPMQRLPLHFEENVGQTDERVDFMARGEKYTIFLNASGAVLALETYVELPPAPPEDHDPDAVPDAADPDAPPARETPAGDPEAMYDAAPTDVEAPAPGVLTRVTTPLFVQFAGANPDAQAFALDDLGGKSNYLTGEDPEGWFTDIGNFREVHYQGLYAGVDVIYQGDESDLQFLLVVAAGADPGQIALDYQGATGLEIDAAGRLVIAIPGGSLLQTAPVLYQHIGGQRVSVEGAYELGDDGLLRFDIGDYDASRPLIIDPTLRFSTYIGGSSTEDGVALDIDGNDIFITGSTLSTNFPVSASGVLQTSNAGNTDAFVFRLNSTGTSRAYATYVGGAANDAARGIDVDSGNAYVVGVTASTNFPTTTGVFQSASGGNNDAFIFRLNSAGSTLTFSTYLGGSGDDEAWDIDLDISFFNSDVYVVGQTTSTNLSTSTGAFDSSQNGGIDAFVGKFNNTGTTRNYLTYYGGSADDVAFGMSRDGNEVYFTGYTDSSNLPTGSAFQSSSGGGRDAFLAKVNSGGTGLRFSTYLGGSGADEAYEVVEAANDRPIVTGSTASSNFPLTSQPFQRDQGGTDAFVTRFNSSGASLHYSSYLGGSGTDVGRSIRVDNNGRMYITGNTQSTDFPLNNQLQNSLAGSDDVFVTVLTSAGNQSQTSTYFGGTGADIGHDLALAFGNEIVVAGLTASTDFPASAGAFQTSNAGGVDALVFRFQPTLTSAPPPGGGPVNVAEDAFESNDTAERARQLGSLGAGGTVDLQNLSITRHANGLFDRDWYTWTVGASGTFSATLNNIISSGDLHLRIFRKVGNVLVEIASSTQTGSVSTQSAAAGVSAGDQIYVWVFGFNFALGSYDMQVSLT